MILTDSKNMSVYSMMDKQREGGEKKMNWFLPSKNCKPAFAQCDHACVSEQTVIKY